MYTNFECEQRLRRVKTSMVEMIKMKNPEPATHTSSAVRVNLRGRYMSASLGEHPCEVVEMSTEEMFLATDAEPRIGEKVVVYVTELGRFEGEVVRKTPTGFAIGMALPKLKHQKLAEQLVWYGNRDSLNLPENRSIDRVAPLMQRAVLSLSNGKERIVKINDISLTGASIETNVILVQGRRVVVGKTPMVVARVFEGGFFGEFLTPLTPDELNEFTKL